MVVNGMIGNIAFRGDQFVTISLCQKAKNVFFAFGEAVILFRRRFGGKVLKDLYGDAARHGSASAQGFSKAFEESFGSGFFEQVTVGAGPEAIEDPFVFLEVCLD